MKLSLMIEANRTISSLQFRGVQRLIGGSDEIVD